MVLGESRRSGPSGDTQNLDFSSTVQKEVRVGTVV